MTRDSSHGVFTAWWEESPEPAGQWRQLGWRQLLDVVGLRELDLAVLGLRDLDVEEIGDGALVLYTFQSTITCLVKEW